MNKIVLIHRPTRLDSLIAKFNTRQQAKFYVEHLNADFSDYEKEHEQYYRQLEALNKNLEVEGRVQTLEWKFLSNYLFGKKDLVVTIGQDGLVANTLKYLDDQLLVGFNPDPGRWDGVLSQFAVESSPHIVQKVLEGRAPTKEITKAKIELSDGQILHAVNDFFIGIRNHTSARYTIKIDGKSEVQSSSGVIVSTPLGRSGWLKSIIQGATGITSKISKKELAVQEKNKGNWADNHLTYAVREPFPSVSTGTNMIFGRISPESSFEIESRMGENGIIFSDGIIDDYLEFNYSVVAKIAIDKAKGKIVVK